MEHSPRPRVSVVIPTRNRPQSVMAAVRSALAQTVPPLEVIVVIDGPDPVTAEALAQAGEPLVRVLQNEASRGAGAARNTGIRAARGDYVALLDDDDTWRPRKLEAQLAWVEENAPGPLVLGCQAAWQDGSPDPAIWPLRPPAPGERFAHYLFVRDRAGEGMLPTPTLLVSRELARACPMPERLRTHEEWDWMLDLEAAGATFAVVMEPLVDVDARPRRQSVSSDAGWRASLAWALSRADDLGGQAFSSFVLTEVHRTATLDRAGAGAQAAIVATALTGRPRSRDLVRCLLRPLVMRRRGAREARAE